MRLSWATCTYAIRKQSEPTTVAPPSFVERWIVTPSRMTLRSPMRRLVSRSREGQVLGLPAQHRALVNAVAGARGR